MHLGYCEHALGIQVSRLLLSLMTLPFSPMKLLMPLALSESSNAIKGITVESPASHLCNNSCYICAY